MSVAALACSVPIALLGAYYLVNAASVTWLGDLEGQRANRVRVRLRRFNGIVMLLMALALYLGISRVFDRGPGQPVGIVAPVAWLAVPPLLVLMLVLAWLDMRLTRKLKHNLLRNAAMKTIADKPTVQPPRGASPRNGAACLAVAGLLIAGGAVGCEETRAQDSATRPSTAPATRPVTRPALREQDDQRPPEGEPQRLRQVEMKLGRETFILQVADTDEERQAGLMFYKSLPAGEGMIFVYPEDQWLSFWMKNTFIPLDIAFVNSDGLVLNVTQMAPHDLDGTPSRGPAMYAIELPLGAARRAGLEAGQTLTFPDAVGKALD